VTNAADVAARLRDDVAMLNAAFARALPGGAAAAAGLDAAPVAGLSASSTGVWSVDTDALAAALGAGDAATVSAIEQSIDDFASRAAGTIESAAPAAPPADSSSSSPPRRGGQLTLQEIKSAMELPHMIARSAPPPMRRRPRSQSTARTGNPASSSSRVGTSSRPPLGASSRPSIGSSLRPSIAAHGTDGDGSSASASATPFKSLLDLFQDEADRTGRR
jgi:hypothetical protein